MRIGATSRHAPPGASLTPEKTLHISVGTAGLMGVLTNAWEVGAWENRPWLTPGMYLRTVSGLPGGRHMAGLEALLRAAVRDISGQEPAAGAVWEYLKHPQEAGQARDLWDILSRPAPQMLGAYYAAFADAYAKAAACLGFLPGKRGLFRRRRQSKPRAAPERLSGAGLHGPGRRI